MSRLAVLRFAVAWGRITGAERQRAYVMGDLQTRRVSVCSVPHVPRLATIRFEIPSVETWHAVSLQIYDIAGRLVESLVDEILESGYHTTQWNAKNFASGVYFVRLEAGNFHDTQKVILLK